eukprot:Protomagalhaensia_wolfi_Nauph_80__4049@NODE_410_length_2577_cov_3549_030339_g307_i0_p2_GENE_NODE_410_length_2577_cov_3549_030339_g307_i0NODE_410_length_2577_cov_3549_030339_g307_i0_p2_ORF_typecomplete_len246_score64_24Redoxin/PF08534_10/5_5e26Redoxin/PF08534_10/5_9e03Glutaredoxin/PF00462_24/9_9e02Glutaredoxin/PF00462_24/2_3e11GST_N_3/PF13417_6/6_8e05Thioredoxin_4/PF13462_6/2_7Thioredoxin_4/PF13462_6/21DUF836/PF05768_14/0_1GST_N_2/PF13409_6/0_25_NODE_410_length_2577_cov_3549_030339_g307_i02901027
MPQSNMEGKQIPDTVFKIFNGTGFEDLKIRDACKGKTVIIFSLPGAFTPTCSTSHLPRYEELAGTFTKLGVDDIYCLSVNDSFVMNSWAAHHETKHVKMLPDGNGEFSEGMNLLVDKSAIGFGKRAWRYSMLVKDTVVDKLFIEAEEGADPYKVSDADTMLKYVNPKAQAPPRIAMLSKVGCPFCATAKHMLKEKNLDFVEIPLSDAIRSVAVGAITGKSTVPQVYVDGKLIGGSDELEKFLKSF